MVKYKSHDLDSVFAALSDGTRRSILERLTHRPHTVSELAEPFDMSLPAVSKHLKVLEEARLIVRARDGRIHRMTLNGAPLRDALRWIERYRKFWEARFDDLETFLRTSQQSSEGT